VYNGLGIGIDFAANLAVNTLDFGTLHLYPESWSEGDTPAESQSFGSQWITDHATMQKAANKPVIIEEYGVLQSPAQTLPIWGATIVSSGLTGEAFWQLGSHSSGGFYWDDGYCIYPDSGATYTVVTAIAANVKARG